VGEEAGLVVRVVGLEGVCYQVDHYSFTILVIVMGLLLLLLQGVK
jgi:hypothetical protein